MNEKQAKAREIILAKVKGLRAGKGIANFQNRLRSMSVAIANKSKLVKSDLQWAEKFINRSKSLKVKLRELGKADAANFAKVLELYNQVKNQDLEKAKELAVARMKNDIAKCVTDEQKSIVKEYYENKTLREIALKSLLKDVLSSEGLIGKKREATAAMPEPEPGTTAPETPVQPGESEVSDQPAVIEPAPIVEAE